MNALHRPLDAGGAASDVDSRLTRVNAPLVPHLASHAELVAEVRRLRGALVIHARAREMLTLEKLALTAKLDCRDRLLDDAERELERLTAAQEARP